MCCLAGRKGDDFHLPVSPIVVRPRADDLALDGLVKPSEVLLGNKIVGIEDVRYEDDRGIWRPSTSHVAFSKGTDCGAKSQA